MVGLQRANVGSGSRNRRGADPTRGNACRQSDAAARAVSVEKFRRSEPDYVVLICGAERSAVLFSAEPDPIAGLPGHGGWCSNAAARHHHVCIVELVWRPARALRSE